MDMQASSGNLPIQLSNSVARQLPHQAAQRREIPCKGEVFTITITTDDPGVYSAAHLAGRGPSDALSPQRSNR